MDNVNSAAPTDFDELADWLLSIGSHFSPAELHGAIVGALAGAMRLPARQWALFGLAVTGADERLDQQQFEQAIENLGGLASQQLSQLASTEIAFRLFLPDDDYDIEQRTESLAHWCKGFLGGFAEARVHSGKREGEGSPGELSDSVMESLQDMAAIAQASATGPEDAPGELLDDEFAEPLEVGAPQTQPEDNNEMAERDYVEVIEYLRLAALTVFTEYGWIEAESTGNTAGQGSSQKNKGPTLH